MPAEKGIETVEIGGNLPLLVRASGDNDMAGCLAIGDGGIGPGNGPHRMVDLGGKINTAGRADLTDLPGKLGPHRHRRHPVLTGDELPEYHRIAVEFPGQPVAAGQAVEDIGQRVPEIRPHPRLKPRRRQDVGRPLRRQQSGSRAGANRRQHPTLTTAQQQDGQVRYRRQPGQDFRKPQLLPARQADRPQLLQFGRKGPGGGSGICPGCVRDGRCRPRREGAGMTSGQCRLHGRAVALIRQLHAARRQGKSQERRMAQGACRPAGDGVSPGHGKIPAAVATVGRSLSLGHDVVPGGSIAGWRHRQARLIATTHRSPDASLRKGFRPA